MIGDTVIVAIPCCFDMTTARIDLHEANTLFYKSTGDQALATKFGRKWVIKTIHGLRL